MSFRSQSGSYLVIVPIASQWAASMQSHCKRSAEGNRSTNKQTQNVDWTASTPITSRVLAVTQNYIISNDNNQLNDGTSRTDKPTTNSINGSIIILRAHEKLTNQFRASLTCSDPFPSSTRYRWYASRNKLCLATSQSTRISSIKASIET